MFNVQGFPMRNAEANAHARPTPWGLRGITYRTFLSVVSLGRLAQDCPST